MEGGRRRSRGRRRPPRLPVQENGPISLGMLWRTSPARSRRSPPAGFILPAQPTLVVRPPAGPKWIHEVKHDGYRLLARKEAGRVVLWSRHGTDLTDNMTRIAE